MNRQIWHVAYNLLASCSGQPAPRAFNFRHATARPKSESDVGEPKIV